MKKTYIIDTNVLIDDPYSFKNFPDSDVIIPIAVVDELDKVKKDPGRGRGARVAIKMLDEISNLGDVSTGILMENNSVLKIDTENYTIDQGDPLYGDTRILACAKNYYDLGADVSVVSNDFNLRVRAKATGIAAESYNKGSSDTLSELYSGVREIVDEAAGLALKECGWINPEDYNLELMTNECVSFKDPDEVELSIGRKLQHNQVKLVKKTYPWGISGRNKEQSFAIDLIMDPNINLVTLVGKAGTGKSLIALAAALELVLSKKAYEKFIIYRPFQAVGNEIGYLPGPQPLDAKILTPNGWSTMGKIQPNDYVIGSDGNPKKVLKIFPKGKKEVFRVSFSDNSFTECCEDHLWKTTSLQESQRKSGEGSVKSLKEIRNTLKTYKSKANNHKIQLINPVIFENKEVIIDSYIMGVLLGDGTLSENYSVYFTSSDDQLAENCKKLLPNDILCKIKNKVNNSYNYSFIVKNNLNNKRRQDNIFAREIKRLGLLGSKSATKFIPEEYKINSVSNRLSLLQGLMDTDGFVSKDGSDVSYSTISNQLANDVKFIVQSLGGIAKINKKRSTYTYNEVKKELNSYVVSISLPNGMCPFRLDRKINRYKPRKYPLHRMMTDIKSIGFKDTKCILVESEDHLYATDEFILTHNTQEEKLAPWFEAVMDNFEVLFSGSSHGDWQRDFEMYKKKGRIEMEALTYIRGRSIPNAIILIDETQNLSREEVKTILTRAGEGTKIILTGDIDQIDNNHLDAANNGLAYVIEKFKGSDISGHVTFLQGERSRLATEASKIL